jgi:hypothetical protein
MRLRAFAAAAVTVVALSGLAACGHHDPNPGPTATQTGPTHPPTSRPPTTRPPTTPPPPTTPVPTMSPTTPPTTPPVTTPPTTGVN